MPKPPESIEEVAAVLRGCASNERMRLQRGLQRRQAMAEALERGEQVGGKRAEWLISTCDKILATCAEAAEAFNEENLDDLISAGDIADALATTLENIKRHTEG